MGDQIQCLKLSVLRLTQFSGELNIWRIFLLNQYCISDVTNEFHILSFLRVETIKSSCYPLEGERMS